MPKLPRVEYAEKEFNITNKHLRGLIVGLGLGYMKKKNHDKKKMQTILILVGIIAAAGIVLYILYRYFTPDYIDEYDDDYDDDFDDDFFDDED